ncbi:MAG: M1 family peptidase, partial [Rhodanobacteraceae bacterium]
MRVISAVMMAALLAIAGAALVLPDQAAAKAVAARATNKPPLTRLPDWVVPQSYDLSIKSDPDQPGYSGEVTIAVDLKKASHYLWLHGKGLEVSSVTITDAAGRKHTGKYEGAVTRDADQAGVARVDFGSTLQPQKLKLGLVFTAPYNQTLQGYYKVVFAGDAYAMTQMEPISARLAFPCFDEPGFKAPLTLSLTIPDADKAVANAAEAGHKPAGAGWKT